MATIKKLIKDFTARITIATTDLMAIGDPSTGKTYKATVSKFLADIITPLLDSKVNKNANITPGTKTKITYDAKGLVTAGADITAADITDAESTNNKTQTIDENSTHVQYPTAKATFDLSETKATQNPGICAETPITAADISINYTTGVLTITPPLGYFHFFTDGAGVITKHTKTGIVNFPALNTALSGIWYFYFDSNGDPITTQTRWSQFETIATLYRLQWNATLNPDTEKSVIEGFEGHLNDISAVDHTWKHRYGTIWSSGLDCFNNKLAVGAPAADGSNTVISFNDGTIIDDNLPSEFINSTNNVIWSQDLGNITPASLNATNSALLKIRQRIGTLNYLLPATRFPFAWQVASNRPQYLDVAGTLQLVSNNYYFVYFVYAFADPRPGFGLKIVSAPNEFSTLTAAQAYGWTDIQNTYIDLSDNEIRPLYRLIFEYKSSYNVGCKYTALRETLDIRKAIVAQNTNSSGSLPATSITFAPAGNIASNNVQSAIEELDTEKAKLNGDSAQNFAVNTLTVASTTKVTNLQADSVDGVGIAAATSGYLPVVSGINYTDSIMSQSGASIVQNGQGSYIFSDGGVGTHNIRGIGAGGAIQFKNDTGTTDRYLRLGMQDNSAVFAPVINIHNNQNVGIGFTTTPNEKIESSANIRANGDFKKNEFFVTRGIAANVNITTTSTTNVQANNSNDYVFTLSSAVTATLNFNDAAYQANSIINFEITGGTAVKFTKSGGTFYQNGVALVSDTYSGYDGTKINFISVRVISATKFEIV